MFVNDVNTSSRNSMTAQEYNAAKERGRRMAAEAMRLNPVARVRVERKYGKDFCRQRYPEAYVQD